MNHPSPAEFTAHLKQRLRQEAFARRDALDKSWRQQASREIAKRALARVTGEVSTESAQA